MALMTERPSWSDERLDDLSKRMDEGFHRNDVEHQEFRREMKAGFDSMNARFDSMNARFDSMNGRIDAVNERFEKFAKMLILIGAGLIGTLVTALISAIVAAILIA